MPAIDPKSLPANLQPGAPSRNLTPQEMRTAVAELKNKAPALSARLNPDDSPVGARPDLTRPANFVEEAPPDTPNSMAPMRTPPQMTNTPNRRFIPSGREKLTRQYAKGGSVSTKASSRADGCAQRGKTKGKMVKMMYGGKC